MGCGQNWEGFLIITSTVSFLVRVGFINVSFDGLPGSHSEVKCLF